MWNWLKTRGRVAISFLSDLGGALAFVVAAIGIIGAAIAGTALFALDTFPQPFLTMLVLGVGLLAAGAALHLLRPRMGATPQVVPGQLESNHPNERAANLEHRYRDAKARGEERMLAERRALRWVREELLDNKRRIEASEYGRVTDKHWRECEPTLLELDDPAPHAKARNAYREIERIEHAEKVYNSDLSAVGRAVDDAVDSLAPATTDTAPT